jgi:hypothetical protein
MSVEPAPATAVATEASPSEQSAPYPNLAALRKAHLDLKEQASGTALAPSDAARCIRSFLAGAQKAGAVLVDPNERRAAQGILDYWSAELAGNPSAKQEDFVPVMLAAPDAQQTFSQLDSPPNTAAPATGKVDQRALVRLSAMARQWRDSNKQPGYLLTGETIEEASRFKGVDSNLDEFVDASQRAVEHQRTTRKIIYAVILTFAFTVAGTGFGLWYFSFVLSASERFIIQSMTKSPDPARPLWWLDVLQPLLPPYDLSGTPRFANVSLPKLRLYAPNFSGVEFSHVEFPKAMLPAASFSGSDFSFDGSGRNDFGGAVLRQAQFRGARIANTSFAGADLYRASFDRAVLCDVDFTGANLRTASFWAVTLNDGTKDTLKKTAWWQALGWPWSEIEKLAPPHQGPANAIEDSRLHSSLKNSTGFKDDIQRPVDAFGRSSAGTVERALALNDLAWTDAVWGIDIAGRNGNKAKAGNEPSSDPCSASGLPANARQAAQQAICIVDKLNREGDTQGKYTALLSNLRDTLAYVLIQNNEISQALETYGEIARDDAKSLEQGEISFRYAIAQYAGGQDKTAAIAKLKSAVEDGRYQPTHELQNLRDYIFPVQEFVDVLRASSNKLWPPVPNQTVCPARGR